MATENNEGRQSSAPDISKITTFIVAERLGPFELAQRWADRTSWPLDRTANDELAELACMSALVCWLRRWQPMAIHRAILAGARLEAIPAAFGNSLGEAFHRWYPWASRQRGLIIAGKSAMSAEEYETVAGIFASAGVRLPDEERADG